MLFTIFQGIVEPVAIKTAALFIALRVEKRTNDPCINLDATFFREIMQLTPTGYLDMKLLLLLMAILLISSVETFKKLRLLNTLFKQTDKRVVKQGQRIAALESEVDALQVGNKASLELQLQFFLCL